MNKTIIISVQAEVEPDTDLRSLEAHVEETLSEDIYNQFPQLETIEGVEIKVLP